MIIVTNRGCHCRKSLLNACLRYPTSFILLTSSKPEKKSKSGSSPFRGCGASDISIHYLQHLDFRVRLPVIFLRRRRNWSKGRSRIKSRSRNRSRSRSRTRSRTRTRTRSIKRKGEDEGGDVEPEDTPLIKERDLWPLSLTYSLFSSSSLSLS